MSKLIGDIEYCGNLKLPTGNIANFANIVNKTRPHTVQLTSAITITNGTFMSTVPYATYTGDTFDSLDNFYAKYMESLGIPSVAVTASGLFSTLANYLQDAKAVLVSNSIGRSTTVMHFENFNYDREMLVLDYYTVTGTGTFSIRIADDPIPSISVEIEGITSDNLSITPSGITYIDIGTDRDFTINSYGEAWDYSIDIIEDAPLYEAQKINDSTLRISAPSISQAGVLSLTVRLNRDTSVYKTVRVVIDDNS